MGCHSRKLSTSGNHGNSIGFLSSLKQLIWASSESNCGEGSDTGSDSDAASSQEGGGGGQEGSSDDELNQGISELSVDSERESESGQSVEVDVRTGKESSLDELSIGEQQDYTFEDHQLVDLSHSSDFDSSALFLVPSSDSNPSSTDSNESELQEDNDDVRGY